MLMLRPGLLLLYIITMIPYHYHERVRKKKGKFRIGNKWIHRHTLAEVRSIMVERSRTRRAAPIWALRRSSFKSTCLSAVTWASSTISVPNWQKALTNSVKFVTDSSLVIVFTTWSSSSRRSTQPGEKHKKIRQITQLHWNNSRTFLIINRPYNPGASTAL